jgi:hypothetical protein
MTDTVVEPFSPDFMSLEEYCQRTGTSYSKAVQDARANRLLVPVVRRGRRFLISRKAYERIAFGDSVARNDAA